MTQFGHTPQMAKKGPPPPSIVPRARVYAEPADKVALAKSFNDGYVAGYKAAETAFMMNVSYHLPGEAIMFMTSRRKSTLEGIITEAAAKYGVTPDDMRSDRRSKAIVMARHEVFYRGLKECPYSTTQIGQALGGKDHSTVIHGAKRFAALVKSGKVVAG